MINRPSQSSVHLTRPGETDSDVSPAAKSLSAVNLGIVCPMANEAATAVAFVEQLLDQCDDQGFESVTIFAVLDLKSTDQTRQLLEELRQRRPALEVVWAPENRSVVDAYLRGYRAALDRGCDWILEIDAGFSHQPAEASRLFEKMRDGYDCVFGSRFCADGRMNDSSLGRYLISRGGTMLSNLLLGTKLRDMTGGFELFTRAALQQVLARQVRSRSPFFQTEIKAYCRHLKVAEVPITYRSPSHHIGRKALADSFRNLWRLVRLRLSGEL